MYRCKECKAECGNDTFDYIEDKKSLTLEQKSEIVSRIFFALCLIVSIIVWLIPVKTTQKMPENVTKPQHEVKTIPNINKIWDDTPLYTPKEQQPEVIREPLTSTPADYARQRNF